ncbi:MAG: radical SAM protein [Myxococcales bacterium]|nr:MAG: radical SAM protein [Myxococcales bacterium]
MARVLLVYTNSLGIPYIDLGLASLSAMLKQAGHRVGLVDFTFGLSDAAALRQLREFRPDLIGMTARTNEFERVVGLAGKIKRRFGTPIYCGGIHPTMAPEDAIARGCFDGVCIGEGDVAMRELVGRLERGEDPGSTRGFWFFRDGEIVRNEAAPLVDDLDALPPADLDLYDFQRYLTARDGQLDVIASRGCPFSCSFCAAPRLREIYQGKGRYVRERSVPSIIAELKERTARWKIRRITFVDEMFNINREKLRRFCEAYGAEIGLPFECDLRADGCDDDLFRHLKAAGCDKVNIGVESGDEALRGSLLRKKISNEQIASAFALARRHGIRTMSYNIIGLPTETREQIRSTIDLNRRIRPDAIQVSIFTPYPGTRLYDYVLRERLLRRKEYASSYYTRANLRYPDFDARQLLRMRMLFGYECLKQESRLRALLLLAREAATPLYLRFGRHIPLRANQLIYRLFWHGRALGFLAK